jgi:hypothetical protein
MSCDILVAMGTYEHGVSRPSPADGGRPRFGQVAWAVLAGLFWAYLWLLVLWFGLLVLGVIGQRQVGHASASLTGWLFPDTSVWAVVSNLTAFAVACGIVAASVRRVVARRTNRAVSGVGVFLLVLLAGMAVLNNHGSFANVAAAWLVLSLAVQRFAFVDERDDRRLGTRRRSYALLAVGVSLLGLMATTAVYGVTHPLWYSSYIARGTSAYGSAPVYHVKAGGRIRYTFQLQNAGFAPVTLQRVHAPGSTTHGPGHFAQLLGATVSEYPRPAGIGPPGHSIPGAHIAGRGSAWITLTISIIPCIETDGGPGPAALNSVSVNYRILGLNQSQTIPLDAPPAVLCRR